LLLVAHCQSWTRFWLGGINVAAVNPPQNSATVAVFATVTFTLDKIPDSATVSTSTVTVTSSSGQVQGDVSLVGSVITFKPKSYLAAGTTYTATLSTDIKDTGKSSLAENYALKFSTIAEESFISHIGSAGTSEQMEGIARFSDGGYAITGTVSANVPGLQSVSGVAPLTSLSYQGANECFFGRFNSNGTVRWYGFVGSAAGNDQCRKVVVSSDDSVYIVGKLGATTPNIESLRAPIYAHQGGDDLFVAKFNSLGQLQWWTNFGSSATEDATGIAEDLSGNIVVVGTAPTPGIGLDASKRVLAIQGGGAANSVVVKFSAAGTLLWYTHIGDTASAFSVSLNGPAIGADNSVYVGGSVSGLATNLGQIATPLQGISTPTDVLLVKLNSSGQTQWWTHFGGAGNQNVKSLTADKSGNILGVGDSAASFTYLGLTAEVAHSGGTDAMIFSLAPSGAINWFQFFGSSGTENPFGIAAAQDGGFAIFSNTSAPFVTQGKSPVNAFGGNFETVLARFDSARKLQWFTGIGNAGTESANFLVEAADGGWATVGVADSNLSGVGGKTVIYPYSANNDPMYAKVKSNGGF